MQGTAWCSAAFWETGDSTMCQLWQVFCAKQERKGNMHKRWKVAEISGYWAIVPSGLLLLIHSAHLRWKCGYHALLPWRRTQATKVGRNKKSYELQLATLPKSSTTEVEHLSPIFCSQQQWQHVGPPPSWKHQIWKIFLTSHGSMHLKHLKTISSQCGIMARITKQTRQVKTQRKRQRTRRAPAHSSLAHRMLVHRPRSE